MLNNITFGRYYKTTSIIHAMHPLAKIISLVLFIIAIFLTNELIPLIILLIMGLLVIGLSNVPYLLYLKQILSIKYILLLILLINTIFNIAFIDSVNMIIRLILIILYSSAFLFTTTNKKTTYALKQLLKPFTLLGININKITFIISLAIRFIPIIFEQSNRVLKAQASRGVDFKQLNLKDKVLALKSLLLPIFSLSFKKSDEISELMELRLYDVNNDYNNIKYNWNYFSIYMPILHVFILLALIMKEVI